MNRSPAAPDVTIRQCICFAPSKDLRWRHACSKWVKRDGSDQRSSRQVRKASSGDPLKQSLRKSQLGGGRGVQREEGTEGGGEEALPEKKLAGNLEFAGKRQ